MNLTIKDFWTPLLAGSDARISHELAGWVSDQKPLASFFEAPLAKSVELSSDAEPRDCNILLVAAPGAVGKSTLAREIASKTSAVYIDLALADPVGGNTISGGLVKANLYAAWNSKKIALLIDGLDEARIRVTQDAFEAFLQDIAYLGRQSKFPIIIFGRTGAVQDAWILFEEMKVKRGVLEIGYFNTEQSIEFTSLIVAHKRQDGTHATVDKEAVVLILQKLRAQTSHDGDRFAGYAPVLQAVAVRISREDNPSQLIARINKGEQPVTLREIVDAIVSRERIKLKTLSFEDESAPTKLYLPQEQLDRLAAKVFHLPAPPFPILSAADTLCYSQALDTWVGEHPFLDGADKPSSAVFDAYIGAHALRNHNFASSALRQHLSRGSAANPFLSEFLIPSEAYRSKSSARDDIDFTIPAEQVGVLYCSLRARLTLSDRATLVIDGSDEELDEEATAEVEVSLDRKGDDQQRDIVFKTKIDGTFMLGPYVEDVNIIAPRATVEISGGNEALLVAPVNIQCEIINFQTQRIIVERQQNIDTGIVFLEAEHCEFSMLSTVPSVRNSVKLSAAWPDVKVYPWTNFAANATHVADPSLQEALRRFRKFVIAFRSHSKGALRRIRYKLEHARMTKGPGGKVLDLLKQHNIVYLVGEMYELDPNTLGLVTGATYAACMACEYSEKTIKFVEGALQ